jgi:hypothetical protein
MGGLKLRLDNLFDGAKVLGESNKILFDKTQFPVIWNLKKIFKNSPT